MSKKRGVAESKQAELLEKVKILLLDAFLAKLGLPKNFLMLLSNSGIEKFYQKLVSPAVHIIQISIKFSTVTLDQELRKFKSFLNEYVDGEIIATIPAINVQAKAKKKKSKCVLLFASKGDLKEIENMIRTQKGKVEIVKKGEKKN
jgi:hypothetical protein